MKSQNQILINIAFLVDLLLAGCSWNWAFYARFHWVNLPPAFYLPPHIQYFKAIPVVVLLTGITFFFSGVYKSHRFSDFFSQTFRLLKACAFLFICIVGMAFFYRKFSPLAIF